MIIDHNPDRLAPGATESEIALPEGLRLRGATAADAPAISELVETVLPHPGAPGAQRAWAADLLRGDHPIGRVEDFSVVEDRAGRLVSSAAFLRQTWCYAGIPIAVAMPEMIVTLPEHRRRGLVRAQFEWHHRRCQERGVLLQAVDGILNFYRQFGYEPSLQLKGYRTGFQETLPPLSAADRAAYEIDEARSADVPFLAEVYEHSLRRSLISCPRDEATWRYEVTERSRQSSLRHRLLIVRHRGQPAAIVAHEAMLDDGRLRIFLCEARRGASWLTVGPVILHHLAAVGEAMAQSASERFLGCEYYLGTAHPLFQVFADELPAIFPPVAWYVRVPDLAALVSAIVPVLEARLADSPLSGHSGELRLGFYRDGLLLRFEAGRITAVQPWHSLDYKEASSALFPDQTFLSLLLGYRSVDELRKAHADCWTWHKSDVLLDILFPRHSSNVLPLS